MSYQLIQVALDEEYGILHTQEIASGKAPITNGRRVSAAEARAISAKLREIAETASIETPQSRDCVRCTEVNRCPFPHMGGDSLNFAPLCRDFRPQMEAAPC